MRPLECRKQKVVLIQKLQTLYSTLNSVRDSLDTLLRCTVLRKDLNWLFLTCSTLGFDVQSATSSNITPDGNSYPSTLAPRCIPEEIQSVSITIQLYIGTLKDDFNYHITIIWDFNTTPKSIYCNNAAGVQCDCSIFFVFFRHVHMIWRWACINLMCRLTMSLFTSTAILNVHLILADGQKQLSYHQANTNIRCVCYTMLQWAWLLKARQRADLRTLRYSGETSSVTYKHF